MAGSRSTAILGLTAAALCACLGGPAAAVDGAPEALLVIAADQHSAYERTGQVVAAVDRLAAAHPSLPLAVLLDGDTQEYGNVVARRSRGAIDFAMLSALARRAPVVVNLGNHETEFFDLDETVARIAATGALVVSNIDNLATGRPAAALSARITLGAREAVVAGVATDDRQTYRADVRPSLGLAAPAAWGEGHLAALLAAAPVRVVLSHAGLAADRQLLPLVPGGTLFVGAHDHLRFVQPFGRTVYVHSGSWNTWLTLAWLHHDAGGEPRWQVEQTPIASDGPADPALAALIRDTEARLLTPEDRAIVAHVPSALGSPEAARAIAAAFRRGTRADAAFIGNTTFGGGLPAGDVTRFAFDACMRFDGAIFAANVSGARLRRLMASANQDAGTPFDERAGEFNVADGPGAIDAARTYRIVTTNWGASHSARYFGEPAIAWQEQRGLSLKPMVLAALASCSPCKF